jgi:hypothetical protein
MSLLSTIGSLVGLVAGGPAGAALGSGLGTLFGGGSISDAFKTGIGSLVTGGLGGRAGLVADMLGGMGSSQAAGAALFDAFGGGGGKGGGNNPLSDMLPGLGGTASKATAAAGAKKSEGLGGLLQAFDNPLMIAAILKATEPKNVTITSPAQQRQLETGERLPDYRGTPAFDYRYGSNFARGGMVQGPGTGTSDSIPSRIYQNGKPVQEARLSDGEFVMTNRAVRGAGGGDRAKGAAEMYRMMQRFERRA